MNNRGSEWRKWDLHIHTKGTNKNDQFSSSSMEDFLFGFFKKAIEKNISAIGVTDYFSIDRYKEVVDYQENINHKKNSEGKELFNEEERNYIKNIFLFPNIELRMLPSTDRGKLINIHFLFNPKFVTKLENDFFGELKNQDNYRMNRQGIIDYGKQLNSNITDDNTAYREGVNRFALDIKTIRDLLDKNAEIKENSIVVVSNSSYDGASGLQKHYDLFENEEGGLDGVRKTIYKISNAIFSANPKDIKFFLGRKSQNTDGYTNNIYLKEIEEVIDKVGSLKPCLVGCDAHKEDELFSKFTWIKADPTFEGLKQIIYEPEERVKIQDGKPDFKEDKEIIDKVKFISPANKFSNEEIYLNPNLNVIIGGKSSGKSILLYSIAKTLLADTKDKLLFKNNGEKRYSLDSIDPNFDFEVTTKGGFSQKMSGRENGDNSIIPKIKYIPQNELVKLAEPELSGKGESLNKLVRNLICEDADSKQKYDDSFIKKVKEYDKSREDLIDSYFDTLDKITKLEGELKTKSNKEVLETNIKTNSDKVEELNKKAGLTEEQIQKYNTIQEKQLRNQQKKDLLISDFHQTNDLLQELKRELLNLKNRKNAFLQNIQTSKFREYYQNKLNFINESISQIENLIKEIELTQNDKGDNVFVKDNIFNNELNQISSEKQSIESELKPYQQNEEIQKQIRTLNESITNDKKLLSEIDILNKKITEKKEFANKTKDDLFQLYKKSFDEYTNIIELLKERTTQFEQDEFELKIRGIAQFNFPKFRDNVLDFTDGRSASNLNYDILKGDRTRISEYEYSDLESEVKKIFEDILSGNYVVNKRHKEREIIKNLLDDYFYDYWEITYKDDKLGEMSTGKASFVILMLIIGLSKSKSPILIDQPEDNLDNRSVSENIISYLRNKKTERQIILVTHNANIVVNADAENVIVANQKGQSKKDTTSLYKFDYINGAIENTFAKIEAETDLLKSMGIKEHIADIVEGGKEAFKNREKKYGFNTRL
ncbi:TrlF family AAA-like ATPase [Capnocytophaga felis]|uniref:ATPase involved in DNA repair n=1 Tax=Capnocytophaga felis TaxID=2267611 RepID=A0A5M4BC96_9FLAO|nr:hypothetical protein [Capnocytophaga felis]GET47110.1 hypothetical protein RCZ01_24120 [Capnocytophaga felis]GET49636.1 hypothetical protein RCZ02_24670 [Capnocytophaga felis]